MQLGIGTWCYPWAVGVPKYPLLEEPLDAKGLLEKAKDLGVDLVQICDNFPLHIRTENELNEIHVKAETLSINIDIGTRGVEPIHLLKYLDIAKILRAKSVRTIIDTPGEQVFGWIKQIIPMYEEAGVSIALENNERFSAKEYADLVRKIDSPNFGINLDTANSLGRLERFEEVAKELMPHTINLHYKDFNIIRVDTRMGFKVVGCPAGEGRVNVDWFLDVLEKEGRKPRIFLELWPPFLDTIERTVLNEDQWVRKSLLFLKTKVR